MLYLLVTAVSWGAILFGLGVFLLPLKAPEWAHKTLNGLGTVGILWAIGFVFYGGLDRLLAEESILRAFQ
jgi:hypothetical protein